MAIAEESIRNYLVALKDPSALRDDEAIAELEQKLDGAEDPIERLQRREELERLKAPSVDSVEDEFVMHAKSWADDVGISANAFLAEGVSGSVLRRAGFKVSGSTVSKSSGRRSSSNGKRVTTEEVIESMPTTAFTTKQLQEIAGASMSVIRKAIKTEMDGGSLVDEGTDPDHAGPGRAPTLYRRV